MTLPTCSTLREQLGVPTAGTASLIRSWPVGTGWARMDALLDVLQQHLLTARDDVVVEG